MGKDLHVVQSVQKKMTMLKCARGHLADVVSQVVNYQRLCSRVSPRERVQTQALDFVCALHAVTNSARVVRACLMATSSLCESIAQAAAVCKASADIAAVDATACKQLYDAITEFVEAGLKGNRAVECNFLSVLSAMIRAFPLLLGPSWNRATSQAAEQSDLVLQIWLVQAAIDGSLLTLCSKLSSQPHIASAYAKHAPMRSKLGADLQAALEPLQEANVQAMLQQSLLNITADSHEPTAATASEATATGSPQSPSTASEAVDHVPLEDRITENDATAVQSPNSTARLEISAQITTYTTVTAATGRHLSSQAQQFAAPGNQEQQDALHCSPGSSVVVTLETLTPSASDNRLIRMVLNPASPLPPSLSQRLPAGTEMPQVAQSTQGNTQVSTAASLTDAALSSQVLARLSMLPTAAAPASSASDVVDSAESAQVPAIQRSSSVIGQAWTNRLPQTLPLPWPPWKRLNSPAPAGTSPVGSASMASTRSANMPAPVQPVEALVAPTDPQTSKVTNVAVLSHESDAEAPSDVPDQTAVNRHAVSDVQSQELDHQPHLQTTPPTDPAPADSHDDTVGPSTITQTPESVNMGTSPFAGAPLDSPLSSSGGVSTASAIPDLNQSDNVVKADAIPDQSDNVVKGNIVKADAEVQPMTLEQQALLTKGAHLSLQVQQAVEEVTGALQGSSEPAGHDGPAVRALCSKLEAMLAHGLKPFAPRVQSTGWASYLPPRRATPFAMLQAAEAATIGAGMLGAQAIVEMARGADDEARLHMWLRAGLNEGCLGARLAALWKNRELYEQWYDRWALLLQAETMTGLFQDTLAKLDTMPFTLPIEVPSKTPTAAAAAALLSSAGSLFKRQQSHYQASTSSPSSMPGQESTTSAENGSVSRKQLHASTKRKPRTITFNQAAPISPKRPEPPDSSQPAASDSVSGQAPLTDPSACPSLLPNPSEGIQQLGSSDAAWLVDAHGHEPETDTPYTTAASLQNYESQSLSLGKSPQVHEAASRLDKHDSASLPVGAAQSAGPNGDSADGQELEQNTESAAAFLDAILAQSKKGTLFRGPIAPTLPSAAAPPETPHISTAALYDASPNGHMDHMDRVDQQQAGQPIRQPKWSEDEEECVPELSRRTSSDHLRRALSRGDSMREGDFASLLMPGHVPSVAKLGLDLTVNRRPPSLQSETPLATPRPMPPAHHLHPPSPANSPDCSVADPSSKAAAPVSAAQLSDADITSGTYDVGTSGNLTKTSDSSTAVTTVDPEDDACSISLVVNDSGAVVLTVLLKQEAADNLRVLLPHVNDMVRSRAESAGIADMSYTDITAMLATTSDSPQSEDLPADRGSAAATSGTQPTAEVLPGSESLLAEPTVGAVHLQRRRSSSRQQDGQGIPESVHMPRAAGADASSYAGLSADTSSSTPVDVNLQDVPTDPPSTSSKIQQQLVKDTAAPDGSVPESSTPFQPLLEPHPSSGPNPAAVGILSCAHSQHAQPLPAPHPLSGPIPAAVGIMPCALGQHDASQGLSDVAPGSSAASVPRLHDLVQTLAGAPSGDDISMQQLEALAGMNASSSDTLSTISDSSSGSRCGSRSGSGSGSPIGLDDFTSSVESTAGSPLFVSDGDEVGTIPPESSALVLQPVKADSQLDQRQAAVDMADLPPLQGMMGRSSREALHVSSSPGASDSLDSETSSQCNLDAAATQATFRWSGRNIAPVAKRPHARFSQVSVRACDTLLETGSRGKGTLYTAYTVEATGSPLEPSWLVRRRFRDFISLRAALKAQPGVALSPAWDALSKAQSVRGQDRTSPDVVVQRQELLHTCMQDLLALNPQGPTLTPLLAFLDPAHVTCPLDLPTVVSTPGQQPEPMGSQQPLPGSIGSGFSNHGRRVRLLTELPVRFTDRELMLRQHGQCAECGQGLPTVGLSWLGRTSSKAARRCEYTGQLYCHSCHKGDMACLPAAVVHHWDFSTRAVCTMAAEFLAATAGQPLLCVGAINPRLYASAPAVGRAHELRKQACTSLAVARSCGSEAQGMVEQFLSADGNMRRLLDEPDFWAMSDLRDLRQGPSCHLLQWLHGAMEGASSLAVALGT